MVTPKFSLNLKSILKDLTKHVTFYLTTVTDPVHREIRVLKTSTVFLLFRKNLLIIFVIQSSPAMSTGPRTTPLTTCGEFYLQ